MNNLQKIEVINVVLESYPCACAQIFVRNDGEPMVELVLLPEDKGVIPEPILTLFEKIGVQVCIQ